LVVGVQNGDVLDDAADQLVAEVQLGGGKEHVAGGVGVGVEHRGDGDRAVGEVGDARIRVAHRFKCSVFQFSVFSLENPSFASLPFVQ
jgi:hypothetical protein